MLLHPRVDILFDFFLWTGHCVDDSCLCGMFGLMFRYIFSSQCDFCFDA